MFYIFHMSDISHISLRVITVAQICDTFKHAPHFYFFTFLNFVSHFVTCNFPSLTFLICITYSNFVLFLIAHIRGISCVYCTLITCVTVLTLRKFITFLTRVTCPQFTTQKHITLLRVSNFLVFLHVLHLLHFLPF